MRISQMFFILIVFAFFIGCSNADKNELITDTSENLDKTNSILPTGGGPALSISVVATGDFTCPVIASYTVTHGDIITRGGGSDPMGWSVYSTHTGSWNWIARVYVNQQPDNNCNVYPSQTPLIDTNFGEGYDINDDFQASEGDIIYLFLWPDFVIGGPSLKYGNSLSKQDYFGTGYLHLE